MPRPRTPAPQPPTEFRDWTRRGLNSLNVDGPVTLRRESGATIVTVHGFDLDQLSARARWRLNLHYLSGPRASVEALLEDGSHDLTLFWRDGSTDHRLWFCRAEFDRRRLAQGLSAVGGLSHHTEWQAAGLSYLTYDQPAQYSWSEPAPQPVVDRASWLASALHAQSAWRRLPGSCFFVDRAAWQVNHAGLLVYGLYFQRRRFAREPLEVLLAGVVAPAAIARALKAQMANGLVLPESRLVWPPEAPRHGCVCRGARLYAVGTEVQSADMTVTEDWQLLVDDLEFPATSELAAPDAALLRMLEPIASPGADRFEVPRPGPVAQPSQAFTLKSGPPPVLLERGRILDLD